MSQSRPLAKRMYCHLRQRTEPAVFKNNRSSPSHAQFVEEVIRYLVQSGRIVQSKVSPRVVYRVVYALSVSVQANGKKRLILATFACFFTSCTLNTKTGEQLYLIQFARGAYMFSSDLKSGCHHVEIFQGHQTYVGFSQKHSISNLVKFYAFTFLPIGLWSAPYVFTKILNLLEKYWRCQDTSVAVFLDDGKRIEKDSQVCGFAANAVRADLSKTDFVTSEDKSMWIPNILAKF